MRRMGMFPAQQAFTEDAIEDEMAIGKRLGLVSDLIQGMCAMCSMMLRPRRFLNKCFPNISQRG